MIDIHSHIIYGVDDGPSTISQSLSMIREAEKLGISMIVASPHYHENIFNLEHAEENYQQLVYLTRDYEVTIAMGYEVFVNPFSRTYLKDYRKLSLDKSGIILLEFPYNSNVHACFDVITNLRKQRITPVITHIERNRNFLKEIHYLQEFIKAGCYIQVDSASIAGVYGLKIKEFTKKLLHLKLVDVVASNAHYPEDYTNWYAQAYNNVSNWVGGEQARLLFHDNAKNILDIKYIQEFSYQNIIE